MPGSEKIIYQQFEVSAKSAYWLRRWTRFPLYFQAWQPRFYLVVKRISDAPLQSSELKFYIEFSDTACVEWKVDVSTLRVGGTITHKTQNILLSPTGDTRICLEAVPPLLTGRQFRTLFAFVVSAEATLVFLILSVVLGAILALLLKF